METSRSQASAFQQQLPTAGWYPNPRGEGFRYWDGRRWTEHCTPIAGSEPARSDLTLSVGVLLAIVGAAFAVVGTFLPAAELDSSIPIAKNSLIQHPEGLLTIAVALIAMFAAIGKRKWVTLAGGVVLMGLVLLAGTHMSEFVSPNEVTSGLLEQYAGSELGERLSDTLSSATPGPGIWAVGIGGALLALSAGRQG
jgi:hypothetical protein